MEISLENNHLIFEREQLLEEEILRCRSTKNFERNYLNKSTNEMITVYRILDSTNENFKLSGPYLKCVVCAPGAIFYRIKSFALQYMGQCLM